VSVVTAAPRNQGDCADDWLEEAVVFFNQLFARRTEIVQKLCQRFETTIDSTHDLVHSSLFHIYLFSHWLSELVPPIFDFGNLHAEIRVFLKVLLEFYVDIVRILINRDAG